MQWLQILASDLSAKLSPDCAIHWRREASSCNIAKKVVIQCICTLMHQSLFWSEKFSPQEADERFCFRTRSWQLWESCSSHSPSWKTRVTLCLQLSKLQNTGVLVTYFGCLYFCLIACSWQWGASRHALCRSVRQGTISLNEYPVNAASVSGWSDEKKQCYSTVVSII